MRSKLNVTFKLDRLHCYDEADGPGNAEPYMWTIFFKIDGTTCRLNESLKLEGIATVLTTPGSHGNLKNTDVDAGDTVPIPATIGYQNMMLLPIPVPDSLKKLGTDDIPAFAGCIVVLLEQDNVTDKGAESGHQALNSAIKSALNSIIPTLGFTKQEITDADIKNLSDKVQSCVENAVKNEQSLFENIWSWLNSDDTIGFRVWKFSGDDLLINNPTVFHQRWQKVWHPGKIPVLPGYWEDNGDWELFGSIDSAAIPIDPIGVIKVKPVGAFS